MLDVKRLTAILTLTTVLTLPNFALAQGSVLQGRIFDFASSHPDFESDQGGPVRGQVLPQLGPDGRMVWSGQSSPVYSDKENFDQWYRDVPGVNASQPFDISLSFDPSSGNYIYQKTDFFPIDDVLLGNEGDVFKDASGRPHNFHFTTHLAGSFSFQTATDLFEFTGDDDLWVFFDGKLGIDLGGTHPPERAAIDGAGLMQLGLEPGATYRLDIFHAERHTDGSNFSIVTNFDIKPPPTRELPAEPRYVLDAGGSKIVTLSSDIRCEAIHGSLASILSEKTSGPRFAAAYCTATMVFYEDSDSIGEAHAGAQRQCLTAEAATNQNGGGWGCDFLGVIERVGSKAPESAVSPGQALHVGKRYHSQSGAHYVEAGIGPDLAIRESDTDAVVWSLQIVSESPDRIAMTEDGNLAAFDEDGTTLWQAEIATPVPGSSLVIDETGVASVMTPGGESVWRSDQLPEQPTPGASYEISMRINYGDAYNSEDGGRTEIQTTGMINHRVTYIPPFVQETEGLLSVDADGVVIDPPALPESAAILAYSINDQTRDPANQTPDYFMAVSDSGEGVILEGEGSLFTLLQEGNRVVLQITEGPFKDKMLIGEDQRAILGDFSPAAFFFIRPPLEPTDGSFVSLESEAYPGQYLRHSGFRLMLDAADANSPSLLRRDATFRVEPIVSEAASSGDDLSCYDTVQGKIAWDYSGSTSWNDANVTNLCGIVASAEPAHCFQQVLHGGVEWAPGQNQWGWEKCFGAVPSNNGFCRAHWLLPRPYAAARLGTSNRGLPRSRDGSAVR